MTTKLRLYNGALLLCGKTRLATLTDDVEARYLLDDAYDDGAVDDCLAEGQWRFAIRAARFTADASVEPAFGLTNAFEKPSDWIVTTAMCVDEFFDTPLLRYVDEQDYWYADVDDLYVKYVSNDSTFGGDLGDWPTSFTEYVKAYLAYRIVHAVSQDKARWDFVKEERDERLLKAQNRDAMAGPTRFPAESAWNNSRRGGRRRGPFGDQGQTGSLTG